MQKEIEVVHALTVDVAGFVEGMAESFPIPERYFDEASADQAVGTSAHGLSRHLERLTEFSDDDFRT